MEFYLDSDRNVIPIIRLSIQLPQEHRDMILAIAEIPPRTTKCKTKDQQTWVINENNFNRWIGLRLDYLQQKQLGFLPNDPLDHPFFDPRFKPWITVESEYWFALLQIAIEGWKLIKEAAIREKREFPFRNPRELIVEVFREKSLEYALEKVFSTELGTGFTLNEIRQNFRESSKFLRGRLEANDEARELEACRSGRWREFCIFAIWEYRHRGKHKKVRQAWKNFLDAHKAKSAFLHSLPSPTDKEKLVSLKWNRGHAIGSVTDSALNHTAILVPPVAIAHLRA